MSRNTEKSVDVKKFRKNGRYITGDKVVKEKDGFIYEMERTDVEEGFGKWKMLGRRRAVKKKNKE